jgi:hypothetical protein
MAILLAGIYIQRQHLRCDFTTRLLQSVYPEYDWHPFLFDCVPRGFWDDIANQRRFLEWIAWKLNIERPEGWYHIQKMDLLRYSASSLFSRYHSMFYVLSAIYPSYTWFPWKFSHVPEEFWEDPLNQCKYVEWLAHELEIIEPEHWFTVDSNKILELNGDALLSLHNHRLLNVLKSLYWEYEWEPAIFDDVHSSYWETIGNFFILWYILYYSF